MKRSRRLLLASLTLTGFWMALASTEAQAQGYGRRAGPSRSQQRYRQPRPRVSPYLNLLSGGGGLEYQTLVRPLNEMRDSQARQSQDFDRLARDVDQGFADTTGLFGDERGVRSTGHASTYFNYSHYYGSLGSSGGGGSRSGRSSRRALAPRPNANTGGDF